MNDPFKRKIKIVDNDNLRTELITLINSQTDELLLDFALKITYITFDKIALDYKENIYIQQAVNSFSKWRKNDMKLSDLRKVIFNIHKLAKNELDYQKQVSLRVLGHALATAHTINHLIVATDYQIKLINILSNNSYEESTQTRLLQIKILEDLIKEKQKV
ncbi:MAG: hypothetical protein JXR48_10635 [Candidatus Delongbacteria bacterium]|nr:hypothetical protein [Candidatus Delongbacteria bacterium]